MDLTHSVRKIYKLSEIDAWRRRVDFDWERLFRQQALDYGRLLYKISAIRTLELTGEEALACARLEENGDEVYCILDFDGDKYLAKNFEGCDAFLSAALTVATFYEIEELVGDAEIANPLGRVDDFGAVSDSANTGKSSEIASEAVAATVQFEKVVRDMPMRLNFSSRRRGLSFVAEWETPDGAYRRAFGEGCLPVESLSQGERETLIRLASMSRKSGFKYDTDSYVLADIPKIPTFLALTLPKWRKIFLVKKDRKVELLRLGEREVDLRPSAQSVDGDAADFEVTWRPSVGGFDIDMGELPKFLSGTGSLRIVPDYGIVRIGAKTAHFVRDVERSREFGFKEGKIPRYMLLALSDFGEKIKLSDDLKAWMDSLAKGVSSDVQPVAEGKLSAKAALPPFLRKYQVAGVEWAENLFAHDCNAMFADEMGLGKTVQTLAVLNRVLSRFKEGERKDKKFLVVCPASVIPVWISETKKFFPDISCAMLSSKSEFKDAQLWISSYTQLRRNKAQLDRVSFEVAVLDEAQFIKNPDAKTTAACMGISAKRKIALTGTPIENRLLDLWTSFRWLMPGLMGSRRTFEDFAEARGSEAVEIVRKQIAPFVLRRLKSEVAEELPEKIYVDLLCTLSDQQKSEYQKLLDEVRGQVKSVEGDDIKKRFTILSLLTRLRQAACDAALLPWIGADGAGEVGGKMSVLLDRADELYSSGKKLLVFSQFTKFLDIIRANLEKRIAPENIFELTGSTRDRSKPVVEFQNAKGAAVMLVSLRAGGTGITLTSADYVFLADPWWNPAVEEQAVDRVHRIGRKGDVFVYRLIAQDTVEHRVRQLQLKKRKLFDDLIGGLKDVSNRAKFIETIGDILD